METGSASATGDMVQLGRRFLPVHMLVDSREIVCLEEHGRDSLCGSLAFRTVESLDRLSDRLCDSN